MTDSIIFHTADLCVIGGGLAGVCAAIAAARDGARVILMHERPVLGGNASSEVRMWVCGAHGSQNRETGLMEEIALENLYRNPSKNHYIADSVLYEKVAETPGIDLLLNCSCFDAQTEKTVDGSVRIASVTGWQMTTQTRHTVRAKLFADCSGDSILAPLTGARYRFGREAASEFGEQVSVTVPDARTMGISCLLQARLCDTPSSFIPPAFATHMTPEMIARRRPQMKATDENFWYLELGGENDCITDTENIRDRLLALAFGMWDYIKNSGEILNGDYWKLEFVGFLPAKRESRRMVGDYVMTQNDILSGSHFPDTVAFGGWGLDDHHPEGFDYAGPPNFNVPTPSPYGIPYRCLYSANVDNLFFAGRNISMTHAAMSSARVMATCAILGEAVGTAAAMAAAADISPRTVGLKNIGLLRARLAYKDCFIPGYRREIASVAKTSRLTLNGQDEPALEALRNGIDRDHPLYGGVCGCTVQTGAAMTYILKVPAPVNEVRITFDSDLDRVTLPGDESERTHITRCNIRPDSPDAHLPTTLAREYMLSIVDENGSETVIVHEENNRQRTVWLPVGCVVTSLTLRVLRTWGERNTGVHILSFDFR